MAVPSRITDMSHVAANCSPTGGEAIGSNLDNYLRGIQAGIKGDLAYKGADIASASTPDIAAITGVYHDITGTSTITGFVSSGAGIWKFLQFDSAVPLIHSTAFPLVDSANITTSPGDVAIVMSEGSGVWRMMTYSRTSVIPPGAIMDYTGSSAPAGWLLCYGQEVSRSTYSALYSVIGDAYGAGDSATTFNVPDFRGRAAFGKDDMGGTTAGRITDGGSGITATALGGSGGDQYTQAHTHSVTDPGHSHTFANGTVLAFFGSGGGTAAAPTPYSFGAITIASNTTGITNQTAGAGSSGMVPTLIVNKIIKF